MHTTTETEHPDSMHVAAKYWAQRQEARNEVERLHSSITQATELADHGRERFARVVDRHGVTGKHGTDACAVCVVADLAATAFARIHTLLVAQAGVEPMAQVTL